MTKSANSRAHAGGGDPPALRPLAPSGVPLSRRAFLDAAAAGVAGFVLAADGRAASAAATILTKLPTPAADALIQLRLLELLPYLKSKRVSPVDLTRACLARIEALNPALNAFITVTAEAALADAKRAEAEIVRGEWRGALHGVPVALKDLIDTAGLRTTAGSALFNERVPEADAEVVTRLKAAGAIVLGKLNMQEFAYGGTSVPSHFGRVSNPWDLERIAGGSSGGSAAAVAAGLCYAALGSDTGGSIREPAALCGIVGLKPTYGRVSNHGIVPLSTSLDHVGPMTRSVADAAVVLQAIAGYDPKDLASQDRAVTNFLSARPGGRPRLRVGLPRAHFYSDLDPEVGAAIEQALSVLATLGAQAQDVVLEVSADRTVLRAEAYAYHAEFVARNPEHYLPETLAKIKLGAGIDAAAYVRARRELERLRREALAVFSTVDLIVTPTAPRVAPRAADYPASFEAVLALDALLLRNTRPFNVYGWPTISVPCGFTRAGLPVGLQIAGPPWAEARVLALAGAFEAATGWFSRRPPLPAPPRPA